MRLFIAIDLDPQFKNKIEDIVKSLKNSGASGNFTKRENLHLTIVFIGETPPDKVKFITSAMDKIKSEPFELNFEGLGSFSHSSGDIAWIGVRKSRQLLSLYNQLKRELLSCGFKLNGKAYKPHLTIARKALMPATDIGIPKMAMKVQKISLFRSDRINGDLKYTEIYAKKLI